MNDQHANLLQAILLELRCISEAMRTPTSREAMSVLKHLGESVSLTFNTKPQDWARGGGGGASAEPADAAPGPKPTGGALGAAA